MGISKRDAIHATERFSTLLAYRTASTVSKEYCFFMRSLPAKQANGRNFSTFLIAIPHWVWDNRAI
jgi:hypothetical protein